MSKKQSRANTEELPFVLQIIVGVLGFFVVGLITYAHVKAEREWRAQPLSCTSGAVSDRLSYRDKGQRGQILVDGQVVFDCLKKEADPPWDRADVYSTPIDWEVERIVKAHDDNNGYAALKDSRGWHLPGWPGVVSLHDYRHCPRQRLECIWRQ